MDRNAALAPRSAGEGILPLQTRVCVHKYLFTSGTGTHACTQSQAGAQDTHTDRTGSRA